MIYLHLVKTKWSWYEKKYINHNAEVVLKKAVFKAANLWGLNHKELGKIIGASESTVSRLNADGEKGINPDSKEGELALLFLRVFRALDAFLGNAIENEKKWLYANNRALNGVPIERMKTIDGLVAVVNYLDAIRGKI
jgi:hypothetical protein